MARKSNMQVLLDAAIADASTTILKKTIASMPKGTTVHELVTALKPTSFADSFHALTLGELAEAVGGVGSTPVRRGPGRPRKTDPPAPAHKKASRKSGTINTRTPAGRARLDAAISEVLQSAASGLRSEEINGQVPGETAQIRTSLNRMIEEGKVSKSGQKRATTYSWGGGAKPTKGRSSKRKKTAKKKTSKKRATRKSAAS